MARCQKLARFMRHKCAELFLSGWLTIRIHTYANTSHIHPPLIPSSDLWWVVIERQRERDETIGVDSSDVPIIHILPDSVCQTIRQEVLSSRFRWILLTHDLASMLSSFGDACQTPNLAKNATLLLSTHTHTHTLSVPVTLERGDKHSPHKQISRGS